MYIAHFVNADSRNICLEKEKKLAAQLIAQKAAPKQLTARPKTQTTKKRQSSATATSISPQGIIGQKRKKVCYFFHNRIHTTNNANSSPLDRLNRF